MVGSIFSKGVQVFLAQIEVFVPGGFISCEVFVPGGSKIGGSKFVVTGHEA